MNFGVVIELISQSRTGLGLTIRLVSFFALCSLPLFASASDHEIESPRSLQNRIIEADGFREGISFERFDRFRKRQTELMEGNTEGCGSASGVYQIDRIDEPGKMRFTYLQDQDLPDVLESVLSGRSDQILQILAAQPLTVGDRKHNGLLIQNMDGWFLIEGTAFGRLPYPRRDTDSDPIALIRRKGYSATHLKDLAEAWSEYLDSGLAPEGYRITKIEFQSDMLVGVSEDVFLDYLPQESVSDYLDRFPRVLTNFKRFTSPEAVRIPPQIYELINDPEFIEAKEAQHFSRMADLIYLKALEIMNEDRFAALFVSLLVTDLRSRGPCGAIAGKRGHTIAPISIFDGESFSYMNPSRRDAAPHFFAYALMANLAGGAIGAPIVSMLGKEQQYRFPRFSNFFRRLHLYSNPEAEDAGIEFTQGFYTSLAGSAFKQERLRIDIRRDKFYNELGLDFGSQSLISVLPSMVINDPKFFEKKRSLGFGLHDEGPWGAYHPDLSVPRVRALPIAERTDHLPEWPERFNWTISLQRSVIFSALQMLGPGGFPDRDPETLRRLRDYVHLASLNNESFEVECALRKEELDKAENRFPVIRFFVLPSFRSSYEPCENRNLVHVLKKAIEEQAENESMRPTDQEMEVFRFYCQRARDDFKRVNACRIHNDEMERRISELAFQNR